MEWFYSWLVQAALGMVIPLAVALVFLLVFKRGSAAARSAVLLGVAVLVIAAPGLRSLFPVFHWTAPALESLQAFSGESEELDEALNQDAAFRNLQKPPQVATDEEEVMGKPLWLQAVLGLWLLGVMVAAGRHLFSYGQSLWMLSQARTPDAIEPGGVVEIAASAAARTGMSPVPVVLMSERCVSAFAGGVIRPTVVVPESLAEGERDVLEMVLVHEFAHVRRRDSLRQLPMVFLQLVFWFHPLVWWLVRRGHVEAEKACDDAVLAAGFSAVNYSEMLVEMSGGRDGFLQERLLAMARTSGTRQPLGWLVRSAVAGGTFLLLLLSVLVQLSPWPEEPAIVPVKMDGLVAYWKCDRGRGSIVADWSEAERHGRIYGAQWVKDAEAGDALRFDGKGDFVKFRAPELDFSQDDFTVSLWLKLDEDSDGGGLLMKGDHNGVWNGGVEHFGGKTVDYGERALLLSGSQGVPHFVSPGLLPGFASFGNSFTQALREVPRGEWVNLVFFCRHDVLAEGGKGNKAWFRVYLNGKKVSAYGGNTAGKNRIEFKTRDWVTDVWYLGLGEAYVVKENHFEGLMHSVMVFDRALSDEEILRFYKIKAGELNASK